MSETLKIRLAARCEAAGRPENEDNFQVAEDLSVSNFGFTTDKIFHLGDKGTLLLVCDGMGGMNAGEVASAIGVETIKNLFSPNLLTSDILANDESICNYMKRAIVKADSQIKEEASKDDTKHGMGSTAVMAWLLGHKVYVAWCGDSRCYRYNPATGLEQLSHDHSYVQDLVDTGQLMPELAFDHPNKNIITRSLGDPRGAARPDTKVFDLRTGDVILLCSDGLCDSLRDNEIEQTISRSLSSMAVCRDALWNDSKKAGWHDNVTIVLAQVVDENAINVETQQQPKKASDVQQSVTTSKQGATLSKLKSKLNWKSLLIVVVAFCVVIACVLGLKGKSNQTMESTKEYDELCQKLSEVSFGGCSPDDSGENIKETIKQYYRLVDLEKEINPSVPKSKDIKERINKAIENKAALIEVEDNTNGQKKADIIRKLKIN